MIRRIAYSETAPLGAAYVEAESSLRRLSRRIEGHKRSHSQEGVGLARFILRTVEMSTVHSETVSGDILHKGSGKK